MNPQDMDRMAAQVEGLFFDLQNRLTADIVRRIKKMDKITATADLQINTLLQLGNTSEFIEAELRRTTGYCNAKIWELYDQVVEDQYTANRDVYEQINTKYIPFEENEELQGWYNAAVSRNQDEILNITQSLGFYVGVGAGKRVFTPVSQIYSGYLNAAAMDVLTGAQSYNTVLRRVSKEMSDSGLQWVDYATGYHCRATTAARRAVLTGVNQMSAEINEMVADDLGTETFEVTWHSGARDTHWWGGRVYTKKQLISVCGLGDVAGLCGANCRHSYHAFIPGISVRTYTDEQLAELNRKEKQTKSWNGKQYNAYEATVKQREMERTMRAQRANICSLKSGGADPDDIAAAQSRYLNQLRNYKIFSKAMGIEPDLERVYVDRLGRVVTGKGFRSYTKAVKSSIINSGKPMLRKAGNTGAFKELPERMSKKNIRDVAKQFGVDLSGLSLTIIADEELLKLPFAGRADHEKAGGITFFPNAFKSEEELIRTIYHEKMHVLQYKEYGVEYVQNNRAYFEQLTSALEEEFVAGLKKEGKL